MKQILILLILSTLTISCSKDKSENLETQESLKVYAYNNSSKKIVELDVDDGSEIRIIADLMFDDVNIDFTNATYSINTNEIIGTIIVPTPPPATSDFDFYFVRVNVISGEVYLNLINFKTYNGFTLTNEGKLFSYIYRINERKIVELDPNNGAEIRIIADLEVLNENNLAILGYSETTNELIGMQGLNDHPIYSQWFTRVSVSDGTFTRNTMEYRYNYPVISNNDELYASRNYTNEIVELDPINGSEIRIIANLDSSIFDMIDYSDTTNEIIGFLRYSGKKNFAKLNVNSGQFTEIVMDGWDYDFILLDQ